MLTFIREARRESHLKVYGCYPHTRYQRLVASLQHIGARVVAFFRNLPNKPFQLASWYVRRRMQRDADLRWAWHCWIVEACLGGGAARNRYDANVAAAHLMQAIFQVDMLQDKRYRDSALYHKNNGW